MACLYDAIALSGICGVVDRGDAAQSVGVARFAFLHGGSFPAPLHTDRQSRRHSATSEHGANQDSGFVQRPGCAALHRARGGRRGPDISNLRFSEAGGRRRTAYQALGLLEQQDGLVSSDRDADSKARGNMRRRQQV